MQLQRGGSHTLTSERHPAHRPSPRTTTTFHGARSRSGAGSRSISTRKAATHRGELHRCGQGVPPFRRGGMQGDERQSGRRGRRFSGCTLSEEGHGSPHRDRAPRYPDSARSVVIREQPGRWTLSAELINGNAIAKSIREEVTIQVATRRARHHAGARRSARRRRIRPARSTSRRGARLDEAGMHSVTIKIPESDAEILRRVGRRLNEDTAIHGILVQCRFRSRCRNSHDSARKGCQWISSHRGASERA